MGEDNFTRTVDAAAAHAALFADPPEPEDRPTPDELFPEPPVPPQPKEPA